MEIDGKLIVFSQEKYSKRLKTAKFVMQYNVFVLNL